MLPEGRLEEKEKVFLDTLRWEHSFRILGGSVPVNDSAILKAARSSQAPPPIFQPHVDVIDLSEIDDWADLYTSTICGLPHAANTKPWRRIISILKGLGAVVCVVEREYVCLDYRSEIASFYSQLNTESPRSSTRLHFFSQPVSLQEIFNLSLGQGKAYLGYVVLRPGGLPLVGRTVIRCPKYIDVAASIVESVNFFGQSLEVEGVPFMQQDESFDVCAHVAAWAAHYSAYCRGLVERRFIAEFVVSPQGFHPMSPITARGLYSQDVADIYSQMGLHSARWTGPNSDPNPRIQTLNHIIRRFCKRVASDYHIKINENTRLGTFITQFEEQMNREENAAPVLRDMLLLNGDIPIREMAKDDQDFCKDAARVFQVQYKDRNLGEFVRECLYKQDFQMEDVRSELYDFLIYSIARPYLESRWPIYCATSGHSLLLCGLSTTSSGSPAFFFHDDQNGPYLASRSAANANAFFFHYQALDIDEYGEELSSERLFRFEDNATKILNDRKRHGGVIDFENFWDCSVREMVVPLPSRSLLDPLEALAMAWDIAKKVGISMNRPRVTILMGADYREKRREEVADQNDSALAIYSSMSLAEWVVIVEGLVDDENALEWEFVFDGSSTRAGPKLQFARFQGLGLYMPDDTSEIQSFYLPGLLTRSFDRVPSRISKHRENMKET